MTMIKGMISSLTSFSCTQYLKYVSKRKYTEKNNNKLPIQNEPIHNDNDKIIIEKTIYNVIVINYHDSGQDHQK